MDLIDKIDKMRVERGWSFYKLSEESGLSQQTFTQWVSKKATPSINALKCVCNAFGITLAEFFAEKPLIEPTEELYLLYNNWCKLSKDEQNIIKATIDTFLKNKN